MKKHLLYIAPLAVALAACSDVDDNLFETCPLEPIVVEISSPEAVNVSETSFTVTSTVSVDDECVTSAGFCYANSSNPTVVGEKVYADPVDGEITATVEGLITDATYYVRAFAVIGGELTYSDQVIIVADDVYNIIPAEVRRYVGPTYLDNYVSIAGWSDRDKWNLANVHDPSVMLADDGYYYMVQTDASYGNAHDGHGHFHSRRSQDLVNWEYQGGTMDEVPSWVLEKMNEYRAELNLTPITDPDYGYWAPVIRNVGNGTYRMYYSIVVTNLITTGSMWGERAFIGLMETTNPADNTSWEDKGYVVCSATDSGTNWYSTSYGSGAYFRWNAIDPSYIITPEGEHWLIYGSWHSGIVAMQLNPETGMPLNELSNPTGNSADDIASYGQRIYTRDSSSRWQASEGPEIVYRNGYYYLFLAYDALDIAYNTRVVRSENITGPYYTINGIDVTNGGNAFPVVTHPYKFNDDYGWVGISHCAIFEDGNDNWYYSSQGRFPANVGGNEYSNAIMMGHVRSIRWTDEGWPLVMPERYGAVPQIAINEAELVGTWEHIVLSYSAGNQRESIALVLNDDYTSVCEEAALLHNKQWSFDADKQILTIGSTKLYVQRECDWEKDGRPATIVYGGFSTTGTTTYWGKKN